MKIEFLVDNIIFAENVAEWIYNEFIKGIRHGISYEQVLSSVKNCHKAELPVRLIAEEELYLRTEYTSNYYRKLEWRFIESCEDEFGLKPDVFKFSLE